MKTRVICYHAVSPTWVHPLALPPQQLLRQVRFLRRLSPLHVTFDDAYRNIELVLPELEQMGHPITVFVCTAFADRGGVSFTVGELATDDPEALAGLTTMSWDQLCALRERGIRIASHTVDHPHLVDLGDDEVRRELRDSKERIEAVVGSPCLELAYPYGEHDARVRRLVAEAGYERGYSLDVAGGDEYGLPRVELHRRDGVARTVIKALTLSIRSGRTPAS